MESAPQPAEAGRSALQDLRRVVLLHSFGLASAVALLVVMQPPDEGPIPVFVMIGLPLYFLVILGSVWWLRSRPIDVSSGASLVSGFRGSVLIQFGLTAAALTMGWVGSRVWGTIFPLLGGILVFLIGLALLYPTNGEIERRQRQVSRTGSDLSLVNELSKPAPPIRLRNP